MPDLLNIPEMLKPTMGSTIFFLAIILLIVLMILFGIWRSGPEGEAAATRRKWLIGAVAGLVCWLVIGAIVPMSGMLETKMLPPPTLLFAGTCFLLAFAVAFSPIGKRLINLPIAFLVLFQGFRLPLELVLHNWYEHGTLPVQMTYEGHNFDIATGILAIIVGIWSMAGSAPRVAVWVFNLVGSALLLAVIVIAFTSVPLPVRQYLNDPPVLLPFNFPFSWILSIAVTGALFGHLVLFRKLLSITNPKIKGNNP
jgi:hypothetical protein